MYHLHFVSSLCLFFFIFFAIPCFPRLLICDTNTGPPLPVNNLQLAGFTTDSVMLAFTAPANSPCVANYSITTNASAPASTTDATVTITRPESDVEGDTYFVSVSAVDFAGRMGPPTSLGCFMFSGKNVTNPI